MTRAERSEALRNDRCEDVEWLLEANESPNRIAQRVGYANLANLTDQLRRWGRHDLVARLVTTQSTRAERGNRERVDLLADVGA